MSCESHDLGYCEICVVYFCHSCDFGNCPHISSVDVAIKFYQSPFSSPKSWVLRWASNECAWRGFVPLDLPSVPRPIFCIHRMRRLSHHKNRSLSELSLSELAACQHLRALAIEHYHGHLDFSDTHCKWSAVSSLGHQFSGKGDPRRRCTLLEQCLWRVAGAWPEMTDEQKRSLPDDLIERIVEMAE